MNTKKLNQFTLIESRTTQKIKESLENNTFDKIMSIYSLQTLIQLNSSSSSGRDIHIDKDWDNVLLDLAYAGNKKLFEIVLKKMIYKNDLEPKYDLEKEDLMTPKNKKDELLNKRLSETLLILNLQTKAPIREYNITNKTIQYLFDAHFEWLEEIPEIKMMFNIVDPKEMQYYLYQYNNRTPNAFKYLLNNTSVTEENIKSFINASLKEFNVENLKTLLEQEIVLNEPIYKKYIINYIATEAFSSRDYPEVNWYSTTKKDYFALLATVDPIFDLAPEEFRDCVMEYLNFKEADFYEFFKTKQETKNLKNIIASENQIEFKKNKL